MGSRAAVEHRYRARRSLAYTSAELALNHELPLPILLRPIEASAIDHWQRFWTGHPARRYSWPWPEIAADYRNAHPDRFEVAIWSQRILCALAVGRIGSAYVGVNFLEGSPEPNHPVRGYVTGTVMAVAERYAAATARGEVRFFDPLPELVPWYAKFGYSLARPRREAPYCWRRI